MVEGISFHNAQKHWNCENTGRVRRALKPVADVHTIRLLITLPIYPSVFTRYITSLIYTFYSLFSRCPLARLGWNMIFASPPIEISSDIVNLLSQCSEYIHRDKRFVLCINSLQEVRPATNDCPFRKVINTVRKDRVRPLETWYTLLKSCKNSTDQKFIAF